MVGVAGNPFRRRQYRDLWAATFVSTVGDGIVVVALPLLVRSISEGDLAVAGVLAMTRLPLLLLSLDTLSSMRPTFRHSPFARFMRMVNGAVAADRGDPRTVMIIADLVRALVLGVLALTVVLNRTSIAAIYVTAFVLGFFEIPFSSAAQRVIPRTVDNDELPQANARLSTASVSGEQFVGPGIGGILGAGAKVVPVLADALSFVVSAMFLRRLPPQPAPASPKHSLEMSGAWDWFRHDQPVFVSTLLVSALAFAQAMTIALLVQIGAETLQLSNGWVGFFIAAIAVGNLLGSLTAERVFNRLGYSSTLLVSLVLTAASYLVASATSNPVVVTAAFIVEGIVVMFGQIAYTVMRQRRIPEEMLGRVFALTRVFIRGPVPLAAFFAGWVASRRSPSAAIFVAGVLTAAAIPLGLRVRRTLRRLEADAVQ